MSWRRKVLLGYLVLLAASHLVWAIRDTSVELRPGTERILVPYRGAQGELAGGARHDLASLAYSDRAGSADDAPVVLLLHGSPGSRHDFDDVERHLPANARLVAPDLPGFGESRDWVPSYSAAAHAAYTIELLDHLAVDQVHVVAFSMGGAVALEMTHLAPDRVASISMVAAIGVQELELFGNYELNRIVHLGQVGTLQAARWLLPHFGTADGWFLGLPYARNFSDTDQRPLRALLEAFEEPMLVLHGRDDFLVPPQAAEEHARIVPQSELVWLEASHFFLWTEPAAVGSALAEFLERCFDGTAPTRADAAPARLTAAGRPFDPSSMPPLQGLALVLTFLLIAIATFVSEDLTCIGTGLLVAHGRLPFLAGCIACFFGIWIGDLLLYFAGRGLGRPAIRHRPFKWFVSEEGVERASIWFQQRGMSAIFLARFIPGLRLPSYFAAGLLHTSFPLFAFYFVLAAAAWTPLLVGFASVAGAGAMDVVSAFERFAVPGFLGLALLLYLVQRIVIPSFTWRGRREVLGRWRRRRHWEFWPPIVFYAPVFVYFLWLALKHRSLSLVTAANPCMPTGGFIGESKAEILEDLGPDPRIARFRRIPASLDAASRLASARAFLEEEGLELPVVLKPDVGQRGSGVRIARDDDQLARAAAEIEVDTIVQEYVPGIEFGVFYVRHPGAERGEIWSITEKRMPVVIGDGERSIEQLILSDERAICMLRAYRHAQATRLRHVPGPGDEIQLTELGTHALGAIFVDGIQHKTPELESAIDELSRGYPEFHFGRYDVRVPSIEALRAGTDLRIVELNGLTAEATHIYDRKNSVFAAWRTLFAQWRLAFAIAKANVARGAKPDTTREMVRELLRYRRLKAGHAG